MEEPPIPAVTLEHSAVLQQQFTDALRERDEARSANAITPEMVKRYHERLAVAAARRGKMVDVSGIDSAAMAREISNGWARRVSGWEAPPPPKQWRELERDPTGAKYREPNRRLVVIVSCSIEDDGRAWIHLSCSHAERIPSWGELGIVKEAFLGDREAYQVMPPRKRYINIDPHVLNVFALFDAAADPVLPDFTRGTGGI